MRAWRTADGLVSRLYVYWRTLETPENPFYFIIVGELELLPDGQYQFTYTYDEDLLEAKKHGFKEVPGFPDVDSDKSYRSPYLFPTFSQFIPQKKRPDFCRLMEYWGVENPEDPLEIIGRTRGTTLLGHRLEIGFRHRI